MNPSRRGELREGDMAKTGLYALGIVILLGVLIIGAGFVIWDAVHPVPLKPA